MVHVLGVRRRRRRVDDGAAAVFQYETERRAPVQVYESLEQICTDFVPRGATVDPDDRA
jgi:hypothetical protein